MEKKTRKKSKATKTMYIVYGMIIAFVIALIIGTIVILNMISPNEVTMPNVVGISREEAQKEIENVKLKFEVEREEYNDEVPIGYVISQEPTYIERFDKVKKGSTVSVVVSKGQE